MEHLGVRRDKRIKPGSQARAWIASTAIALEDEAGEEEWKRIHIGSFAEEADAARAYDYVEIAVHGLEAAQTNFGALTGDERDQVVYDQVEDNLEPFPDIEGNREQYEILSWDMEPGDVAIFNARMIHGGSGLLHPDRDLKVFNTQWLGDDVRVMFRPEGMDPDHSQVMTEHGLAPGDRVGGPLYPELWRREPVAV